MNQTLLQNLTETLGNEVRLSNIELEAMSRMHKMTLNGFKRFFRYRAKDRFKHSLYLKRWGVDYSEINIPFDVSYSSGVNAMSFENIMTYVYNESKLQLVKLKNCMDLAFQDKEITLANKLNCLIDDQEEEQKYFRRLIDEWTTSKLVNDNSWQSRKDSLLHDKYKKKEKKYN